MTNKCARLCVYAHVFAVSESIPSTQWETIESSPSFCSTRCDPYSHSLPHSHFSQTHNPSLCSFLQQSFLMCVRNTNTISQVCTNVVTSNTSSLAMLCSVMLRLESWSQKLGAEMLTLSQHIHLHYSYRASWLRIFPIHNASQNVLFKTCSNITSTHPFLGWQANEDHISRCKILNCKSISASCKCYWGALNSDHKEKSFKSVHFLDLLVLHFSSLW